MVDCHDADTARYSFSKKFSEVSVTLSISLFLALEPLTGHCFRQLRLLPDILKSAQLLNWLALICLISFASWLELFSIRV